MHQGKSVIITVKGIKYLVICHSDSMTNISSCKSLSKNQDIRQNKICHKAITCAAKPGCNLVKNQKNIILVTQFSCSLQE